MMLSLYIQEISVKSIFNCVYCMFSLFFANELHSKYQCREVDRESVTITVPKYSWLQAKPYQIWVVLDFSTHSHPSSSITDAALSHNVVKWKVCVGLGKKLLGYVKENIMFQVQTNTLRTSRDVFSVDTSHIMHVTSCRLT